MAATNSAFVDEIVVNVEPDENEDGVEDHLNCSAASSTAAANEPDLSGISGSQTPGQQQHRRFNRLGSRGSVSAETTPRRSTPIGGGRRGSLPKVYSVSFKEDYFTCRRVASGYDAGDPCEDPRDQLRQPQTPGGGRRTRRRLALGSPGGDGGRSRAVSEGPEGAVGGGGGGTGVGAAAAANATFPIVQIRNGLGNLSSRKKNYSSITEESNSVHTASSSLSKTPNCNGTPNGVGGTPNLSGSCNAPLVYCIHGNKFGVTKCCESLDLNSGTDALARLENGSTSFHSGGSGRGGREDQPLLETSSNVGSTSDLHCHPIGRESGIDKKARRKLIIASILCLLFMSMEIVGGFMANSLAIATDAAHLLTDFASFMISLFAIYVASRPATKKMSFGWHRAEVIGATASVLLIWVVTGILVYMAIERCVSGEFELNPTIMLITSGVGVLVNIVMGAVLGHSHGGSGHSHGGATATDSEGGHGHNSAEQENINVKAAFIHVLGDFLQSLGVFIAALVIYFKPEWALIDPVCTFVFSILVLATTLRILRDTVNVLMEGIPRNMSFSVVQEAFLSVEGIVAVHNLRIWGLTTDKTALSAHLAITRGANPRVILREASEAIRRKYNIYEMTLQVEDYEQDMSDCNQCQNPTQ